MYLERHVAKAPDATLLIAEIQRPCIALEDPAILELQDVVGLGIAAVEPLHAGSESIGIGQLVAHMLEQQVVPSGGCQFRRHAPEFEEAPVGGQHRAVRRHHQDAFVRRIERHLQPGLGASDLARQFLLPITGDLPQQGAHEEQAHRRHDARRDQAGQQVVGRDSAHEEQVHQGHDEHRDEHGRHGKQQPQSPAIQSLKLGNESGSHFSCFRSPCRAIRVAGTKNREDGCLPDFARGFYAIPP